MNREELQDAYTAPALAKGENVFLPYLIVTKPGVVAMVIISAVSGMYVAGSGLPQSGHLLFWTVFTIGLATAAAAALNNFYDRDIDLIMRRTSGRPLPSGAAAPAVVLGFGLIGAALSVACAYEAINILVAELLAASIFIYSVVYTVWMKRRTPMATFVGGVGGALPPVIGYAAVKPELDMYALALFIIIFAWQHPHFWSLALKYIEEYRAAKVNNHPVALGVKATKRRIALWAAILAVVSTLPWHIGMAGGVYLMGAAILGLANMTMSVAFLLSEARLAMRIFYFSLAHLPALYLLLLIDLTI